MWAGWKHITKLDPDKYLPRERYKDVLESGTDAVIVGGTQNITREKVEFVLKMLEGSKIPVVLEPASREVVVLEGIDFLFIPSVLNSRSVDWVLRKHYEWVELWKRSYGSIPWEKVVGEGYIVLNPDSAVAKVTRADAQISAERAAAIAELADQYLGFPIVYIEYSGRFGDPKLVEAVSRCVKRAKLFYGGGINSREKAKVMSRYAAIVVGNIVYEDFDKYLETIV
ncbi:MAG: heptaprenylglyceryl phosphate synthase [Thermoproteota archaeon]|nr:MAG: heptaprenylglyceryl phosphate synthase [Candidatus Korarchaeota archaeon]RLG56195.1 MAG: heptaprenylglyceryl phosphate synthase [Candidatus Korarchaeota archaeon]